MRSEMISWPQIAFLSEEISGNLKFEIPKQEVIVKTEEYRPKIPHMINHNIKANVWTEIPLPRNIEGWQMSCRDDFDIQYCFEPSAATFKTLKAGSVVAEDTSPLTLPYVYVRCANDTTVEIELWKS